MNIIAKVLLWLVLFSVMLVGGLIFAIIETISYVVHVPLDAWDIADEVSNLESES